MPQPNPVPRLRDEFRHRFGRSCAAIGRAPGRVNLIGEHTDYNDGFVLPMALEQCTWVAAGPRDDARVRVVARDLDSEESWLTGGWNSADHGDWSSYIAGVVDLLRQRGGRLSGCDVMIRSEVPVGGGLSSSAALEVATAKALGMIAGVPLEGVALADLCRTVEHEYAKVPCGIMDQYVSVLARAGHAFLLDCRSRAWEHIPLRLDRHVVAVVNSGVQHKLATGEYAVRQQQCQEAVAFFKTLRPEIRALRDVNLELVEEHAAEMEPKAAARARHVVSENQRTVAAGDALRCGDLAALGTFLAESHRSLRDDYEVSCQELDALVEIVSAVHGVVGARMTGGGFGGCIVAIAARECVDQIRDAVRAGYDAAGFGPARMILTGPGAGASLESA